MMRPRLLVVTLGVLASSLVSHAALAHEGAGTLAVEQAEAVAVGQIRYLVRLTWNNDGHVVLDATINATLIGADGTPQTPVPLPAADQDGRYAATVTFPAPGAWTVRFTAVRPVATLEQAATIEAPATTTTLAPSTTLAPTTTTPAEDGTGGGGSTTDSGSPGDGSGGLLAAVAGMAVVTGVTALVVRRRRVAPGG